MAMFDREMCCALRHAMMNNRHLRLAWSAVVGPMALTDGRSLEEGEPFQLPEEDKEVEVRPTEMGIKVYRSFASQEFTRLSDGKEPDRLQCRHRRNQHLRALQRILTRIRALRAN